MQSCFLFASLVLTSVALAQPPTVPAKFGEERPLGSPADLAMKEMFETRIKAEWRRSNTRTRKPTPTCWRRTIRGVEVDGRGERNKVQALNELSETNVFDYTLFGFKLIPAGPDAALVIYEVTMEFPPSPQELENCRAQSPNGLSLFSKLLVTSSLWFR
jgi:hypothetical protein